MLNRLIDIVIRLMLLNEKDSDNFKYYVWITFYIAYIFMVIWSIFANLLLIPFFDFNYRFISTIVIIGCFLAASIISAKVKREKRIDTLREEKQNWTEKDKKKYHNSGVLVCTVMMLFPIYYLIYVIIYLYA